MIKHFKTLIICKSEKEKQIKNIILVTKNRLMIEFSSFTNFMILMKVPIFIFLIMYVVGNCLGQKDYFIIGKTFKISVFHPQNTRKESTLGNVSSKFHVVY